MGGQILVSRSVHDAVRDVFSFRDMGSIRVKGRRRLVETYDVVY
jgi:class 3 adenylate cyclase